MGFLDTDVSMYKAVHVNKYKAVLVNKIHGEDSGKAPAVPTA